jgi:hypothetical protein
MKIYEKREALKRETHCRFCGNKGHLWVSCTVPAQQLKLRKEGKAPDFSLFSNWYAKQYNQVINGEYPRLPAMYKQMEQHLAKQVTRKQKMAERKAARERLYGKKRRSPSCGFCGGKGHNRKNCEVMKNFVDDLKKSNQAFRQRFYDEVVLKMGIAEGALVAVKARSAHINGQWVDNYEGIGIISGIEWDKVNMGVACSSWEYRSQLGISIVIGNQTLTSQDFFCNMVAKQKRDRVNLISYQPTELSRLFGGNTGGWGLHLDQVLAPSENLPDKEWFKESYSDCWEYIVKNKKLSECGYELCRLIADFHPHRTGRGAGKLKKRLAQYGWRSPQ